jgi:protein O-mannosyl-transferase
MKWEGKPNLANFKTQVQCCSSIVLLGMMVYGNHLHNAFQFDSVAYIVNNPNLDHPEEILTFEFLFSELKSRGLLRMSMAVNAALGGDHPFGYHLFNLTFHIFNTILLFFISEKVLRCFQRDPANPDAAKIRGVSLFTALLFLCHPIQIESVVYIISRSEVLAATFYLGGFFLFQSIWERRRSASGTMKFLGLPGLLFIIFALGFSVKQTLITLPAIILLYALCQCERDSRPIQFLKRWKWVLAGIFLVASFILLRKLLADESFLIGPSNPEEMVGRKKYMLSQPSVLLFYYLKLLLFPVNLNIDPDIPVVTHFMSWQFLGPAALLSALIYLTMNKAQSRIYFFGLSWFLIILSPSSSIITLHDLAAEHRVYLASYGFYLILALGLWQGIYNRPRLSQPAKQSTAFFLLVILVGSLGMMTVKRNLTWRSELTLWEDTRIKSPNLVRPLINLGRAHSLAGQTDRAIFYYETSLKKAPTVFALNYNLGELYQNQGRVEEALELFEKAETLSPEVPEVHGKLGEIYMKTEQYDLADRYFKRAIELNPKYPVALRNLGIINYFHLQRPEQGIVYFSRSLTLDPDQPEADEIRQLISR